MGKIRIIKKNDTGSLEYEIGDIFEIEGTWYGGVHISGRTGIPVSLDKEEYVELMSEMEDKGSEINEEGKRTVAENQEQDIKAIAEALNCEYEAYLVMKDTGEKV